MTLFTEEAGSHKSFFSGQIVIELELEFLAKESLKYIICMVSFENVLAAFKIMTINVSKQQDSITECQRFYRGYSRKGRGVQSWDMACP